MYKRQLQSGLLRLGIGRQLVRHGPTADALAGVYPGGDVQPLLQRLVLLPKDAHMAGSRLDQLLRCAGEQDGSVVNDHDLVADRLHILNAVSYTHLDVYKRQRDASSRIVTRREKATATQKDVAIKLSVFFLSFCLLYTSRCV